MTDIPFQNDISELFRILAGAWSQKIPQLWYIPKTANALLEKNFTKGSVAMSNVRSAAWPDG
jgi:hypothetical protein